MSSSRPVEARDAERALRATELPARGPGPGEALAGDAQTLLDVPGVPASSSAVVTVVGSCPDRGCSHRNRDRPG